MARSSRRYYARHRYKFFEWLCLGLVLVYLHTRFRLVHRELDVQLDERRSRRVLEVNDAIVDLDLLDWSQFWGLPRQREGRGELGGRDFSGRRAFGQRNYLCGS